MIDETHLDLARLLLSRLERLSADSVWAHRASGLRGSLLRTLAEAEGGDEAASRNLDFLIERGFAILEKAAREILPLRT